MKYMDDKPMAQGDLLIVPAAEIPTGVKPAVAEGDVYVIGHSETGHHHVIEKERVEVFEPADDAFCLWIKTLGKSAELKHMRNYDTHESIVLRPDRIYQVRRQREYTPEGWRRAAD